MPTYTSFLQELGLSPNEAAIFEALLRYGELSVAEVARRAGAHRRNVYDALQRLLEKGLVHEVLEHKLSRYQAVNPEKLLDIVNEKRERLLQVMPEFQRLFLQTPSQESVLIYRGVEGLKTYMRDILRKGKDYYSIGAKGIWADPRVKDILPSFLSDAKKKGIAFHILYDPIVNTTKNSVIAKIPANYRFLPSECSTPASLGVFGDVTVVLSDISAAKMKDDLSFTVITNQKLADSVRSWFDLVWRVSQPPGKRKRG